VEALRERTEDEVDTLRDQLEEEFRARAREIRAEATQVREREEARLSRVYRERAIEEVRAC
jgi:ElaB/YqjD/DUF883 family membrane-anchored ribosome-binding protein